MAIGAPQGSVQWLVLREVILMLVVGLVCGIAAATATSQYVKTLLFGLPPNDRLTMAMAAVTLTLVALGAGFVPARRAARVDPMRALREE